MSDNNSGTKISINLGLPWFSLWIFTIAFAKLGVGSSFLALLIWPYYLGDAVATVVGR